MSTHLDLFNARFLAGLTFAEAGWIATPVFSWMQVMVGDPLYQPFIIKSEIEAGQDDDFKALEVAEKLKLQLKKLELIRILSDHMLQKKRFGVHIFTRGMKGGIRSINTPVYDISLYELLKSYAGIQMQKTFQNISIPKLPV